MPFGKSTTGLLNQFNDCSAYCLKCNAICFSHTVRPAIPVKSIPTTDLPDGIFLEVLARNNQLFFVNKNFFYNLNGCLTFTHSIKLT